jgi:hypothetical protein
MLSELKLRNTTAFSSLLFCYDGKQADNNKLSFNLRELVTLG